MAELTKVITTTLALDTNIYAAGDTLSDLFTIMPESGKACILQEALVIDADEQSEPFDILFFSEIITLTGAKNAAFNVSAADMKKCIGYINTEAADYTDFNNSDCATFPNLGIGLESTAANNLIYVATVSRGTGTYTAGGLVLKLTFLID